jgi:hypothetical protein
MTPEVAALFPAAAEIFSAGHSDPLPANWKAGDVNRSFESALEQAGGKRGEAPEGPQTFEQPPLKRGKAGEAVLGRNEFFSGEHFWQRKSIESTGGLVDGINPSFKKRGLIEFPQQLVHSWKQTAAAQRTPPGEVGSSQGELAQAAHGQGKGQTGGENQNVGGPSGQLGGVQNGQNAGGQNAEARGEAHVGSDPKETQGKGEGGSGLQKEGGWRDIKEPAVSGGAEKPELPCAHDQEKGPPPNPGPAKVSRFRVPDTLFLPRERKGKRGKAVPRVGDDVMVRKDVRGSAADNPLEGGGAGRVPELPVRKGGIAVELSGRVGVSFGMVGLEQKKGLGLANWEKSGPGNQGNQLGLLKDKGTPEGERRPADAPAPVALLGGGFESSPTGVLEGARAPPKEDKIRSFLQRWETRSADKWQENEAAAAGGGATENSASSSNSDIKAASEISCPGGVEHPPDLLGFRQLPSSVSRPVNAGARFSPGGGATALQTASLFPPQAAPWRQGSEATRGLVNEYVGSLLAEPQNLPMDPASAQILGEHLLIRLQEQLEQGGGSGGGSDAQSSVRLSTDQMLLLLDQYQSLHAAGGERSVNAPDMAARASARERLEQAQAELERQWGLQAQRRAEAEQLAAAHTLLMKYQSGTNPANPFPDATPGLYGTANRVARLIQVNSNTLSATQSLNPLAITNPPMLPRANLDFPTSQVLTNSGARLGPLAANPSAALLNPQNNAPFNGAETFSLMGAFPQQEASGNLPGGAFEPPGMNLAKPPTMSAQPSMFGRQAGGRLPLSEVYAQASPLGQLEDLGRILSNEQSSYIDQSSSRFGVNPLNQNGLSRSMSALLVDAAAASSVELPPNYIGELQNRDATGAWDMGLSGPMNWPPSGFE